MKTVNIHFEVKDTDDAIRLINAIDQVIIGELKGFNVCEAYEFNRDPRYVSYCNRHSEEETHANND